jgi:glycosyltransferase involved in cell wall biosynthesis
MKALFFLPTLRNYSDLFFMLQELSCRLHELYVLVGIIDAEFDSTNYPNLHVIEIGFRNGQRIRNLKRTYSLSMRLIKAKGINIVHDTFGNFLPIMVLHRSRPHPVYCASFFCAERWRIRHVWSTFGILKLLKNRMTLPMFYGALIQWLVCHFADVIIVQAKGLIERFAPYNHVSPDKFAILPNNVHTEFWKPSPRNHEIDTLKSLRLLYAGGIDHSRGIFVLIDTMNQLKMLGINASLTVGGTWGPFAHEKAISLVKELALDGQIDFCGRLNRDQMHSAYCSQDIFIYQTINDGSPRCVFEAASCGIPIIASHHPGIDLLDPDGHYIHFTQFGDVDAIVKHIETFLHNRHKWLQMADVGRFGMRERFGNVAVAQKYQDLYNKITIQSQPI